MVEEIKSKQLKQQKEVIFSNKANKEYLCKIIVDKLAKLFSSEQLPLIKAEVRSILETEVLTKESIKMLERKVRYKIE